MGVYRLYTGSDGESHIEELKPAEHPELWQLQATTGIRLTEFAAQQFLDWHPAPRRQWVIILSGELEIGLGDGSLRRFGPGDARLVEDTTGRGHTTRTLGDQPCLAMTVPLAG
jgi:quercetin dioxygenase-like cupin family protein